MVLRVYSDIINICIVQVILLLLVNNQHIQYKLTTVKSGLLWINVMDNNMILQFLVDGVNQAIQEQIIGNKN